MLSPLFLQLILIYGLLAFAQTSFQLGYIPLAVKTPYLHAWIMSNEGQGPANVWPNFVSGDHASYFYSQYGWVGLIRVDNQGYSWMASSGSNSNFTRTVTSEITPTKSIFRLEVGPIQFNVTFFSPIEPTDYVRQSMPFSYMFIDGIAANDSQSHTIQFYSDISAQWVSKEDETVVEWNTTVKDDMICHRVARQSPVSMVENGGIPEDTTGYYAMAKRSGLTWQTGGWGDCRGTFTTNGILTNSGDVKFRPVSDDWPVFAFSVDLGTVHPGNQPDPVVWSLGLVRDPLVAYTTDRPTQNRSAYYWLDYPSIEEVMSAFLSDFSDALSRSLVLDNKVLSAASTPEYAGILSLVTRQIFASMDITVPSAQPGQFKNSDVKIFMKDIGVSLRTNPVEVIYGALPALIFFNPSLARDLLQPLLEFQSSPSYPNPYAAPDLSASYPLFRNDSADTHTLAVENCGNMLIMAYAQAVKSGDGALASRYYPVLQRWADFLIENTLHPRGFITADGIDNPDMSNLALKGILGIYSMAKITEAVGASNTTYMDHATQLIKDWKQLAIATDGHIQAVYGQTNSWGLMYNLFPAVWLGMGLIEDTVLEHQAQFYAQQSSPEFGYSLDSSRPDVAYPHWTLMAAATIPDNLATVRNRLILSTYKRAYMPNTQLPLPMAYKPSNGDAISGHGSPILGAAFALAALGIQNVDIRGPQTDPSGHHRKNTAGAIVGGVLGGFAFLLLVTTAIFLLWRRRKQQQDAAVIPNKYEAVLFTHDGHNNANSNMPSPLNHTGARKVGLSSTPLPTGVTTTPQFMRSRKQRETLVHSRGHIPVRSEPAVTSSSNPNPTPVFGAEDFRVEVEQLRREMESIRHITEVPPEYT